MSYIYKNGRGMMGLGDSTPTCRTGPAFFQGGNWWVPIKDSDGKTYNLMQTNELAALPLCSSGSSSGGGLTDLLGKVISGVTDVVKAKVTPAPVTNITSTSGGGMSTTTKIAIAGGAVVVGALVIRSLKKR